MRGQKAVVGLDDARGNVWRSVDFKEYLRLLSVINGETLKDGNSQTRSSNTSVGVSQDETLQAIAIFSWLLNVWKNIQQEFSRCTCVQKKGCTTNNSPIMFTSQLLVCWRAWKRLSFVVTERKSKLTQRTFLCTICQQNFDFIIDVGTTISSKLLKWWNWLGFCRK